MTVSTRRLRCCSRIVLAGACAGLVAAFSVSPQADAHPHNWIELNSRFVLNDSARLVQVNQRWEFDVFFSTMTLADMLKEHGSEEKGLTEIARQMVRNLAGYDYFSTLRLDGSTVALDMPQSYRLITKERDGQTVLELEMSFDIESDVMVENKTLEWRVFDPTYYIAMMHTHKRNIEITGGDNAECTSQLQPPDPPDDLVVYAQSLDRNQKSTNGLGANFAETTIITCS